MSNARLFPVMFLISFATLTVELSLVRLFSVIMFYHFAFLAVSMALFGLGVAGLYLFLFRKQFTTAAFERNLLASCLLFALTLVAGLAVILNTQVALNYSGANVLKLLTIYVAALLPFLCSGIAISMILFFRARDISRFYFWDLGGAAVGAICTVPVLNLMGPINACLVSAITAAAAACLLAPAVRMPWRIVTFAVFTAMIGVLVINTSGEFLKVKFYKGLTKPRIAFEKWNSFSHISVSDIPGQPNMTAIDIDADARTYIIRDPFRVVGSEALRVSLAPQWIASAPNVLLDHGDVLIIGPGGGIDVVFALAWGARHIDAVEINPVIVNDIMRGTHRAYSGGLYYRDDVDVHIAEGRSFVAQTERTYDMIQLSLVDTWAASNAGAFSLSENNLYTLEAFSEYLTHLNPDGLLAVTRWLYAEPRQALRVMTTMMAAAEKLGIATPADHIAILALSPQETSQEMATIIFKRSGLTRGDLDALGRQLSLAGGRIVYSPFEPPDGGPLHKFAQSTDREKFFNDYGYNVRPATDDRPFFFNTIRLQSLSRLLKFDAETRKTNLGVFNLLILSVIATALVAVCFLGPLLARPAALKLSRTRGVSRQLLYFVAIGMGFILIEMALMQRFVLYLDHPVHALAVVVSCLLVSAGLGSYFTKRFDAVSSRKYGRILFPGIAAVILLELLLLPYLLAATHSYVFALRVGIAVATLLPLGFLLGQPFPLEIKYIERENREVIPWVWGLNGIASVLGSVAAVVVAMVWGLTVVIAASLVAYLMAAVTRSRNTIPSS